MIGGRSFYYSFILFLALLFHDCLEAQTYFAPILTHIPQQTIEEGGSFADIALDDYVSDADTEDSQIVWTSESLGGNVTASVSSGRIATFTIVDPEWNGTDTIRFTASDGTSSASTNMLLTITPVAEAPVVSSIPSQSISEGGSFTDISLDDYVSDADTEDSQIVWTSESLGGNVTASISSGRIATFTIVDPEWNGTDTIRFTASDSTSSASTNMLLTITPVAEAPVVSNIPSQSISEGGSFTDISLDDYVSDSDTEDSQIVWTSESLGGNVTASISSSRIATFTIVDPEWNGIDTIRFTASDGTGSASTDMLLTITAVADAPSISSIPSQTIAEGGSFTDVSLDSYVTDSDTDDSLISWSSVSAGGNITASISSSRVATFTIVDPEWNGTDTIRFTASDGTSSATIEMLLTITEVADAPVVSSIPSQTIAEGGSFTDVSLDSYVSDVDTEDSQIAWTSESLGGNVTASISSSRIATFTIVDPEWNGTDTIRFTASDGTSSATIEMLLTITAVADAPVVSSIPSQTIAEGGSFTDVSLDSYVSDVDTDDSLISWSSVSAGGHITASISSNRIASFTIVDPEWNGTDTITFIASDGNSSVSTAILMTITAVDDSPVISSIPSQTIAEGGSFYSFSLDEYVTDADTEDSSITWTSISAGGHVTASISANRQVSFNITDPEWNGTDTITFTASDGTSSASTEMLLTISVVEDSPVVTSIPSQTIAEGESFTNVSLDAFVVDADTEDSLISWKSKSLGGNITASISSDRVASFTILDEEWNGTEIITFTASDEISSASTEMLLMVTAVNDAPVIESQDTVSITENTQFEMEWTALNVSDPDDDYPTGFTMYIQDGDNYSVLGRYVTPDEDFAGELTIPVYIADSKGEQSNTFDVIVTVEEVNVAPVCINDTVYLVDGVSEDVNVLQNDYDANGDDVTVELTDANGLSGTLQYVSNGQYTYSSVLGNYCVEESFTYEGCDVSGYCSEASVVFIIDPSDDDMDNISNFIEGLELDSDGDGLLDYLDDDSDGDGISDETEGQISDLCTDNPVDTDGDGTPDYLDLNSDNDDYSDQEEGTDDCDGDGIVNYLDESDDCSESIEAPDTFSPNGDGVNDYFVIPGISNYERNEIYIYNRWGNQVFQMKNYDNSWDGKSDNAAFGSGSLPQGVYYYVVKLGETNRVIKGMVYIKK